MSTTTAAHVNMCWWAVDSKMYRGVDGINKLYRGVDDGIVNRVAL